MNEREWKIILALAPIGLAAICGSRREMVRAAGAADRIIGQVLVDGLKERLGIRG